MKVEGLETTPTPLEIEKTGLLPDQEPSWNVKALLVLVGKVQLGQKQLLKKFLQGEVPLHVAVVVKSLL